MKTSSLIKKCLILGLTVSLLGMNVFGQSYDDDDEVILIDEESDIMLIAESESAPSVEYTTTTGTILVKGKNAKPKVLLTFGGKKKFTLEPASDSFLSMEDLISYNGKIVKLTGIAEKKNFKVLELAIINPDDSSADAK